MAKTFSDNWCRVADLRLGLRPSVSIRLHTYRGRPWYVLHERTHNTFHRVNPATYRFLSRLTVDHTIEEIWLAAIEQDPQDTPGQEDAFQLLASLYRGNLLYMEGSADGEKLLARAQSKKQKPVLARLSELMFMRIPLVDPEPALRLIHPLIRILFGPPGLVLALILVGVGVYELLMAGHHAWAQADHLLQMHNVVLLYVAVFMAKALHELGHACLCKKFGGEVRSGGIMLLMFTPLPFVDVTASWAFRNRFKRALVGAGGMLVDLTVAGAATVVWAHSPPGTINELAYNLMFSTTIYTVVFNINPLMRFDGYYILADLIEMPNLHEQAAQTFRRWFGQVVLAADPGGQDDHSPRERLALIGFYLASNLYRLFVMGGVVLFIADAYFGIGLVVALALGLSSFVLPVQRGLKTLASPTFHYQRMILFRRFGPVLLVLVLVIFALPLPDNRVLPGVVEARDDTHLYSETGGIVQRLYRQHGEWVAKDDVLAELENPELDSELASAQAQIQQATHMEAKSISENAVDLAPIQERLATLGKLRASLLHLKEMLVIRAPHDGIWVAPELDQRHGVWLGRGAELGEVVDDRRHRFVGIIRQEDADVLTQARRTDAQIRLEGDRGTALDALDLTLVPHSQVTLPTAALSPAAGGDVPVSAADPSGKRSAEPFFLLQADLPTFEENGQPATIRSGRSGWIRLHLPWRPLAVQGWGRLRQFFQRRYQL